MKHFLLSRLEIARRSVLRVRPSRLGTTALTGVLLAVSVAACVASSDQSDTPLEPSESQDLRPQGDVIGRTSEALTNESLVDYAAECDRATATEVPDFNCDDGTDVPMTNPHGSGLDLTCDRPNRLNQECDPGSKFQVLVNRDDAYVVAHCRKRVVMKGNAIGDGVFADIAVIQHNKKNGATCFYQALQDRLPGHVVAPKTVGSVYPWLTPASTAGIHCVRCHDNGPIIRSPYLTQITEGKDKLPGAGDITFNNHQPYAFVGDDFASWRVFQVNVPGNTCNNCHRMGVSEHDLVTEKNDGTARDFGLRATQEANEVHKNDAGADSPLWMTPGTITFNKDNFAAASVIADCAAYFAPNAPLPNSDACRITEFTTPLAPLRGTSVTSSDGNIATVSRAPNTMETFYIAADGSVWGTFFYDGGQWTPYQIAGAKSASTSGRITAVSRRANRIDLFWITPAGAVQQAEWHEGSMWLVHSTPLAPNGSAAVTSGLAVVSRIPTALELFYVSPRGVLQDQHWYEGDTAWTGFSLRDTSPASTYGGIAAVSRIPGSMEVFYLGLDGSVRDQYWYDGSVWKGFNLAGARTASASGGVAAVSRNPSALEMWFIGADGSVQDMHWYDGVTRWTGMTLPGAGAGSAGSFSLIAATARLPGTLEVWFTGSDNSVQDRYWYDGGNWTVGQNLLPARSAATYGGIAVASRSNNAMEVFMEGADGSIQDQYWYQGGNWTGFALPLGPNVKLP